MLMKISKILMKNKISWDIVHNKFNGWCFLPSWGPYAAGSDIPLISRIKGLNFAEICYGSGHSIKYLLDNGAKSVYGIDFSESQTSLAKEVLSGYLDFNLQCTSMEEWSIEGLEEKFDCIFSVYGVGWCSDIDSFLRKIYKTLKPGGKFIFSWEHPMYECCFSLFNQLPDKSYFQENREFISSWAKGNGVYIQHRKISTWVSFLRESGFKIIDILEPGPVNINENIKERSVSFATYYNKELAQKIPVSIIFVCQK